MKLVYSFVLVLLCLMTQAVSADQGNHNAYGHRNQSTSTTVTNTNTATSSSTSTATGGNASVSVGDANSSVSVNQRYQAPALAALPSGPCVGGSGTVSVPGIGIGGAKVDKECEKREAIRILKSMGMDEEAKLIANDLEVLKDIRERKAKEQEERLRKIAQAAVEAHRAEIAAKNAKKETTAFENSN